jgi:hypothetical protein
VDGYYQVFIKEPDWIETPEQRLEWRASVVIVIAEAMEGEVVEIASEPTQH